jgi:hypothetical protein
MATVAAQPFETPVTTWGRRHTLAVGAILAAIVCVGALMPWAAGRRGDFQYARFAAWLGTLALFLGLAVVVGQGMTGLYRGIFVDERRRMSLSRVQMFLWTVLVLSAYLSAALANVGLGSPEPLGISVPQTLLQAMGLGTLSLVAAPAVLHGVKKGAVSVNAHASDSRWTDLLRGEEHANTGGVDLARVQLLLVTIVLVVGYAVVLGDAYLDSHVATIGALPGIDAAFVVMLAISHGGYLAKKAVPRVEPPT